MFVQIWLVLISLTIYVNALILLLIFVVLICNFDVISTNFVVNHGSHTHKKSSAGKIQSSTGGRSYPGNGMQPAEDCWLCFHCAWPEVEIYKRKQKKSFLSFVCSNTILSLTPTKSFANIVIWPSDLPGKWDCESYLSAVSSPFS